jgi:glycosyltransferase involved in cell wall biosynthesis
MSAEGPLRVSVIVSTKNEEKNLGACLERLAGRFAEVFVVDSASTDGTRRIAEAAGVPVVDFRWDGRFPKKRNWALRNAPIGQPWVLFLDADELVTDRFVEELRRVLPSTPHSGFWISFENYFLGTLMRHGDQMRKLCVFRRGAGEYERIEENRWSTLDMEIHEHPIIEGTVGSVAAPLIHADQRDFASHIAKHNEYSSWETYRYFELRRSGPEVWAKLTARQRKKYQNLEKWWLAPVYFMASYFLKRGFLDGYVGFQIALFKGFYFWEIRLKIEEQRRLAGAKPKEYDA